MTGLDAQAYRLLVSGRRPVRYVAPFVHPWLSRAFPAGHRKRVLLIRVDDRIASPQFYPFYHYEQRFADAGYVFRSVAYPALGADALIGEADAIFLQTVYKPEAGEIERLLERICRINPDAPISFFDWFAPTDVRFADRVADHVAFYTKKALLRDRTYYRHPQRGHTALEDVYCSRFNLIPDEPEWDVRPDIVDKLELAPGFATAPVFLADFERQARPPAGDRPIDVHARFAIASSGLEKTGRSDAGARTHWYTVMRREARAATERLARQHIVAWQGMIPRARFMAELQQAKICFSPFGFGELCWRDIEAILAGAVLVKPSMEHVDCFCDIFRPGETYVPVKWDLSDLDETIARLVARPEERQALVEQAYQGIRDYLAGPRLVNLVDRLTAPRT